MGNLMEGKILCRLFPYLLVVVSPGPGERNHDS
jgi:hypothetical protein